MRWNDPGSWLAKLQNDTWIFWQINCLPIKFWEWRGHGRGGPPKWCCRWGYHWKILGWICVGGSGTDHSWGFEKWRMLCISHTTWREIHSGLRGSEMTSYGCHGVSPGFGGIPSGGLTWRSTARRITHQGVHQLLELGTCLWWWPHWGHGNRRISVIRHSPYKRVKLVMRRDWYLDELGPKWGTLGPFSLSRSFGSRASDMGEHWLGVG